MPQKIESGLEKLATKLLAEVYTSTELKEISVILEEFSLDKSFKSQALNVSTDERLTDSLKKSQMLYLFKDMDNSILYNFFSDMFNEGNYMLFNSRQFDYFDEFVKTFQLKTEELMIVNLMTAIEVEEKDMVEIAKDLTDSLGRQAVIHLQVNPAIMGGAKVRIGNLVFDFSLRSKFHQFQRQWLSSIKSTTRALEVA